MADRFEVRPLHDRYGGDGWSVYDTVEKRYTGGWFAFEIKEACNVMCRLANEGEEREQRRTAEP